MNVAIDDILVDLANENPVFRMDANEALERLGNMVHTMAPESFLIKPKIVEPAKQ